MAIDKKSFLKSIGKKLYKHTPIGVAGEGGKLVKNVGGVINSKLRLIGKKSRLKSMQKGVSHWSDNKGKSPKDIIKKVDKGLQTVEKYAPISALKKIGGIGKLAKMKFKTYKAPRNAVKRIMDKYYPKPGVVADRTHAKRQKEFTKLYKEKGPKEVIAKAQEYMKQWKIDNKN